MDKKRMYSHVPHLEIVSSSLGSSVQAALFSLAESPRKDQ